MNSMAMPTGPTVPVMDMYNEGPTTPTNVVAPSAADPLTTRDQLLQANQYLNSLRTDRAQLCSELDQEAQRFLSSPFSMEQDRRFRLIYQLLRYQIHTYTHSMYSILQEKLATMARVQTMVGSAEDDPHIKALTIALVNGRIVDATIRVVERAIEAVRELNGRGSALTKKDPCGSLAWQSDSKQLLATSHSSSDDMSKRKATKRSRLPAAAVKEMRTWLDRHWDDPVPTHEEKSGFAESHGITTKQVENWFINIRMREWRPAMRRALDHAEETGSYAEFSRLLQHTADGNVFKKFLEEREQGRGGGLVPPPSLQRFIGADSFAAFVGDKRDLGKKRMC